MDLNEILKDYGPIGSILSIIIGTLVFVIIRLDKQLRELQSKYNDLNEKRLEDAKSVESRLVGPLEKSIRITEAIYDLIINSKRGA